MASSAPVTALDASSTAADVIAHFSTSLVGKNILVTGASSGIGAEAARVFALAGATVWFAGRDDAKTAGVRDAVAAEVGPSAAGRLHTLHLDLSSLASVRAAAAEFLATGQPLHILLNNAGCMALEKRTLTEDGFEMQFGTNHLGHFVLTNALKPALVAAAFSRVVNVSSMAHRRSPVLFEDTSFTSGGYVPWTAYGQSKTANILHAIALNKRLQASGVVAVSLHPGVIETELWRHTGPVMPGNKSIPQGAATSVYCAVAPDIVPGGFYDNCAPAAASPYATDDSAAERLWELSERLTTPSL